MKEEKEEGGMMGSGSSLRRYFKREATVKQEKWEALKVTPLLPLLPLLLPPLLPLLPLLLPLLPLLVKMSLEVRMMGEETEQWKREAKLWMRWFTVL